MEDKVKGMEKGKIYCPVNGWDCPYYGGKRNLYNVSQC